MRMTAQVLSRHLRQGVSLFIGNLQTCQFESYTYLLRFMLYDPLLEVSWGITTKSHVFNYVLPRRSIEMITCLSWILERVSVGPALEDDTKLCYRDYSTRPIFHESLSSSVELRLSVKQEHSLSPPLFVLYLGLRRVICIFFWINCYRPHSVEDKVLTFTSFLFFSAGRKGVGVALRFTDCFC